MTIAAAYRHAVAAGGSVAFDTELAGDRAATTMRLDAAPGETVTLTKYRRLPQLQPDPRGVRRRVDRRARRPLPRHARCRRGGRLGACARRAAGLARPVLGTHRHRRRRATTRPSRRSAGTCSRWLRPRPRSADAASPPRRSRPPATTVTTSGTPRSTWSRCWRTPTRTPPATCSTSATERFPRHAERAIEMSQRGALYPWRTINGEEASAYYPAGTAQYHIDADIAYAIDRYVTATGDTEFLRRRGRRDARRDGAAVRRPRVLRRGRSTRVPHPRRDGSRRVHRGRRRQPLHQRDGALHAAVRRRRRDPARGPTIPTHTASLVAATGLADDEVAEWTRAADSMCVLYDAELGINPQDDAFLGHEAWDWEGTPDDKYPLLLNFHPLVIYRHQVLKQADVVLANFLRGDEFAPDLQRRNFDYYDPITTGDSSLSACVQSIMAAEVGHADLAMRYFRESLYLDIANTHGNTVDGAHLANVGGVWACLVHGFAGVRDSGTHVRIAPRLPAGWQRDALPLAPARRRHRDRGRSHRRHGHRRIGRAGAHPRRRGDHRGRARRLAAGRRHGATRDEPAGAAHLSSPLGLRGVTCSRDGARGNESRSA